MPATAIISSRRETRYEWFPIVPGGEGSRHPYASMTEIVKSKEQTPEMDLIVTIWHYKDGAENANTERLRKAFPDTPIILLLDKDVPKSRLKFQGADAIFRLDDPHVFGKFQNAVSWHLSKREIAPYRNILICYATPVQGSFNPPRAVNGTQPR